MASTRKQSTTPTPKGRKPARLERAAAAPAQKKSSSSNKRPSARLAPKKLLAKKSPRVKATLEAKSVSTKAKSVSTKAKSVSTKAKSVPTKAKSVSAKAKAVPAKAKAKAVSAKGRSKAPKRALVTRKSRSSVPKPARLPPKKRIAKQKESGHLDKGQHSIHPTEPEVVTPPPVLETPESGSIVSSDVVVEQAHMDTLAPPQVGDLCGNTF